MRMRSQVTITCLSLLIATGANSQSISVGNGCIGIIREAANATRVHGTAFVAGPKGHVITAAHVVEGGRYTFQPMGTGSDGPRVEVLKVLYALPQYDLAVLEMKLDEYEDRRSPCESPLDFGDMRKVRPGDIVFYFGFTYQQGAVQANFAPIQAVGSALNGTTAVDFVEFYGVGLPGYSGGPVVDTNNGVIGIMREAWRKQGVKGGDVILMNRAFSLEPVRAIEEKTEPAKIERKKQP